MTGHVPSTEELANRSAIQETIFSHCRGLDRADEALLKSCYWEDATVDYGFFKGDAHAFCELIIPAIQRYRATHHQVSNLLVARKGSNAVVETYLTAYHHQPDDAKREMSYFGRYVDHFQRRGGCWKIFFRQVVADWNQNWASTDDLDSGTLSALSKSARMPEDPIYSLKMKIIGPSQ